jgi:hypothetical protein
MMKRSVLLFKILSREKTVTALLNTSLRMKEDKGLLKKAFPTFISAFHMFSHLIPNSRAFMFMTREKTETFSIMMIGRETRESLKSSIDSNLIERLI